ncbi:MAG: hypothetical protein EBU90_22515 [Proteobacteria bacterium]|nr:hypothetical protein [Pseudomonadota bacterium]
MTKEKTTAGAIIVVMNCSSDKFANAVERLRKAAMQSALNQKHSACLVYGEQILSIGVNKRFNIRFNNHVLPLTIHAEVDALSNIHPKNLKGLDVLVIRVNKAKQLVYSRPCNSCIDKLSKKGIRKAYYSDIDGNIVYEFVDNMPKLHDSAGTRMRQRMNSRQMGECC